MLFPADRISVMYNVKGDPSEHEEPYTMLTCDGLTYKVLETKEEIIRRLEVEII